MGSRRDCTWILGLAGFRVVTMDEAADSRLTIRIERRGVRRYTCSGCGRRTGRVRSSARSHVGRPAVGRASRHAGLSRSDASCVGRAAFAPSASSSPIRRRGHAALAPADRRGLSVDADQSRRGAPRRELGQSPSRGERVSRRLGSARASKRRPRHLGLDEIQRGKGAAVLDGALRPGARRGDRLAPGSDEDERPRRC